MPDLPPATEVKQIPETGDGLTGVFNSQWSRVQWKLTRYRAHLNFKVISHFNLMTQGTTGTILWTSRGDPESQQDLNKDFKCLCLS